MQQQHHSHLTGTFWVLCISYASAGVIAALPGTTLILLAAHTHVALNIMAWALTCSSLGVTCGIFLAGQLSTHFNPKYILIAGVATIGTMAQLIFWTQTYWILLMAEFAFGLGFAFIDISLNIAMSQLFHGTLNRALNTLHSCFGIGALLGPLLITLTFATMHDATWAYIFGSIISLVSIILLTTQTLPAPTGSTPQQLSLSNTAASRRALKQTGLWLLALQVFLYVGAEGGFSGWLVTAISKSSGYSIAVVAPAATLLWLGLTIGRLLSTQMLKRASLHEHSMLYICIIGAGLCGIGIALSSSSIPFSFSTILLTGTFLGPIFPSLMAMASRRFPYALSTISSVMLFSARASGFVFPVLVGTLMTSAGVAWALAFPALTLLALTIPFYLSLRLRTLQLQADAHTMKVQAETTTIIQS